MRYLLIICHERWLTVNIMALGTTKINKNNFDKMSYMKKKKKSTECRTLKNKKLRLFRSNVVFDETSYRVFDEVVFGEMSCTDLDISDSFKNRILKLNYILN